jgi:uncharacterized membrane protein
MSFLEEYFINPIIYKSGYNLVNTIAYGIIAVLVLLGTLKLLEKLKIRIDSRFFIGLFPYIFLGSLLRSLEDMAVLKGFWFVTPMVYVVVWVLTFSIIGVSLALSRRGPPYWIIMLSLGLPLCLWAAKFFETASILPLIQVAAITAAFGLALFAVRKVSGSAFLSQANSLLILTHIFDASTTFVAVSFYGFGEQHVLAGFLMGSLGNFSIFALKLLVIPLVLYLLDVSIKEKQPNSFAKLCIFILGFGPGMRNLLSVMMAV